MADGNHAARRCRPIWPRSSARPASSPTAGCARLGVRRLAEAQYPQLAETTRRALDAYARGVNAWLASRGSSLPVEFLVLGLRPEPWSPVDLLVWLKLMALRLSSDWREELLRVAAHRAPDAATAARPVAGQPTPVAAPGAAGLPASMLAQLDAAVPGQLQAGPRRLQHLGRAGPATASGRPILANDPHLPFALPGVWYLARLVSPARELAGATSPGFPAMILGHNGRIAWGLTTSDIDVEDLFVERVDPADPARYLAPGGSLPFVVRQEVIGVKGGEPETLTVRLTRHGPVISDLAGLPSSAANQAGAAEESVVMALAAPYLEADDRTPDALFASTRLPTGRAFSPQRGRRHRRSRTSSTPTATATSATSPPALSPARPRRRMAAAGGLVGRRRLARLRAVRRPAAGLRSTLRPPRQRQQSAAAPRLALAVAGTWDPGFRAERIEQRLADDPPQTLETSAALQMDSVSLMARRLLPLMLERLPEDGGAATGDPPARRLAVRHGPESPRAADLLGLAARARAQPVRRRAGPAVRALLGLPAALRRAGADPPDRCGATISRTPAMEDCPSRLQTSLEAAMAGLAKTQGTILRRGAGATCTKPASSIRSGSGSR